MEEKIILSIEIQKGQGEKEVDAMTRKITDLQVATANLKKENNELIKQGKQNSQEFVENSRQIEINKQKISEATASRKGLVQSLLLEENSIKSLRIANANLIKQRDQITTSTKEGRAEIARLNEQIDANNEAITENLDKAGKQKAAIGGYTEAIKDSIPFFRQAEQAQAALGGGMSSLNKIFLASGIGLFVAGLLALIQYFKRTEEGGDALNKIMFTIDALLGNIGDAAATVGKYLFDAFNNPKQAVQDLGRFLQDQLVNRFVGMLTLIPRLGQAVELLFAGEFAAAGKVAGDAVGQVVLGVENATDKIQGFIYGISDSVDEAIKQGERLSQLDQLLGDQEEALTVGRAKTALEVAKLREAALRQEGDARKEILLEAIELEKQLSDAEVAFAVTRLKIAKEQQEIDGVTGETKLAVAQAEAAVIDAQAARFEQTLRFQKEIAAIDEAHLKEQAALLAEANKILDENEQKELERQARIREALTETEELRLEQAVLNAEGLEERINREIELETFKTFALLDNEKLIDEERQLIAEKGQANINAIIKKGADEKAKIELAAEKKLADEKKKLRDQETQGREAAADAAVGFARAAFGETKGVAIAEATINTIKGVARALSDYVFPYSLIVGALVGAAGAVQIAKIASTKPAARGMLIRNVSRKGGMLRGPSHARGGIPFTVSGEAGFEAEGGEAIINKRSTKMFRPLLSEINQAGGGVAFGKGGVTKFQTGGIGTTQTRQAFQAAESRTAIRDTVQSVMENMPPIFVTVEDINERAAEYSEQSNKAFVA